MGKASKHSAEQIVNLLRQIEVRVGQRKCMVCSAFASAKGLLTHSGSRKCIRPLASQPIWPLGHDELRACRSQKTWFALKEDLFSSWGMHPSSPRSDISAANRTLSSP
jgi:hypothetical protein